MELKNRLYPYPVLSKYSDDYVGSIFSANIVYEIEKDDIIFNVSTVLENKALNDLVSKGDAYISVHLECPSTSYRELFKLKSFADKIKLSAGMVNKSLQAAFFVIAEKDIHNFYSDDFNEMYEGLEFDIERHNILAIGEYYKIPINKDYDEIKNISSIFSIIPNYNKEANLIKTELISDKIVVEIPKKQFDYYKIVSKNKNNHPILHSMLIVPILIEVLQTLKTEDGIDNFEDYRWFNGLEHALEKINLTIDEINNKNISSYIIAQKLLDSPMTNGIDSLLEATLTTGDDDYES